MTIAARRDVLRGCLDVHCTLLSNFTIICCSRRSAALTVMQGSHRVGHRTVQPWTNRYTARRSPARHGKGTPASKPIVLTEIPHNLTAVTRMDSVVDILVESGHDGKVISADHLTGPSLKSPNIKAAQDLATIKELLDKRRATLYPRRQTAAALCGNCVDVSGGPSGRRRQYLNGLQEWWSKAVLSPNRFKSRGGGPSPDPRYSNLFKFFRGLILYLLLRTAFLKLKINRHKL